MSEFILAFDTAMSACSACVSRGGEILARRFEIMDRGQAEALVPMIADVLDEAGLAAKDIGLVATTQGPGAFTGVRIGLATAHGLALARGIPVLGLTTLEAVAAAHRSQAPLLVVLETKRSDYYVQLFGAGGDLAAAPRAMEGAAIRDALPDGRTAVAGDGADRLIAALGEDAARLRRVGGADVADAAVLAQLAAQRLSAGADPTRFPALHPLYLRAPDVRVPGR